MKLARLLSAAALAVSVAAVTAGYGPIAAAQAAISQPAATQACRHIAGPFHRDRNMITGAGGQRYIPYGVSVTGLGNPSWKRHSPGDDAEINAAAASWCSNTVRLQIFQYALLGPGKSGSTVNTTFLGRIEGEVSTALNDGLVVVINDQTEGGGNPAAVGMPTTQTEAFWKVMSGLYGHNPDVIFDLFNEPRRANYPTEAGTWKFWKHGGNYHGYQFIGMEPLALYVRSLGARNLFWIEGPHTAGTLDEIVSHQITHAGPLEYGINHPGGVNVRHGPADWYTRFGYAAKQVPMTDTEWTNYSSTRSCWPDAPKTAPAFLNYLARKGMGLTAWTLVPGVLAASADLANPTVIKSDWACRNTGLDEGAGSLIMNWFKQHNS
ncbi:MAG: endoglucanase [Streptosporangiaceae bacterium]|nr:endoglucanase [Streptosporangiaceae bacterium]